MTWSTWKTPPAKHQAGEEWCLQCGTEGKPERAVGVDEDGEPACGLHRVKEIGAGLNAAGDKGLVPFTRTPVPAPVTVVYKQAAERPAPDPRYGVTKAVSSAADQPPAAAPSPVQTSAKEHEMERSTPKFNDKPCGDCGSPFTPSGARSQFCTDCAAERLKARDKTKRQNSGAKHKKKAKKLAKPDPQIGGGMEHCDEPFAELSDDELRTFRDKGKLPARLGGSAEPPAQTEKLVLTLMLSQSGVQKLLNLLLAD